MQMIGIRSSQDIQCRKKRNLLLLFHWNSNYNLDLQRLQKKVQNVIILQVSKVS